MADGFKIADAFVEIHARGHDRIGNEVRDEVRGDRAFDDAGADAGDKFASGFIRDANGRLHDERGRFVAEGRAAGEGFGRGFGDGVERERGGLLGRLRSLGSSLGDNLNRGLLGSVDRLGGLLGGSLTRGLLGAITQIGSALTGALKLSVLAAGIATVGAAAGAAAVPLLAFVGELLPVGGLLASLPGLLMTGAAALITWKLATYGVGEAMSAVWSGDAKALEDALAKLTPAAAAFVQEFEKTLPAFKSFQEAAATGFFSELNGSLARFADLLKETQPSLQGLATDMGALVRTFLDWMTGAQQIGQFNTILSNTSGLVAAIREALTPLMTGFLDLAVVGSNWLSSFAPGLKDVLATFGEWMSMVSVNGNALAWLNDAVVVLKQVWAIVKDLGGIFQSVFAALEKSGAGALGVLGQLLDKLNAFLASAKGQDILVTIFKSLAQVGKALMPVIEALGDGLATIAPQVAAIAVVVGPVLTKAVNALAPAIAALGPGIVAVVQGIGGAVQGLAPALLPLGQAISQIFVTLRPAIAAIGPAVAALLPGIAQFAQAFATGISALAPALKPIGEAFSGILVALSPLLPVIGQLAAMIATSLAAGVQAILPSLKLLVTSIGQALFALAPVVPLFVQLAATLINNLVPALAPLLPQIATLVTHLIQGLVPAITPLIPVIAQLAGELGQFLVSALAELLKQIVPLLPMLSDMAKTLGLALLDAVIKLTPSLLAIVSAFLDLLPVLAPLLPMLAEMVVKLLPPAVDMFIALAPLVIVLVDHVLKLVDAVMPLLPLLFDLVLQLMPTKEQIAELAKVIREDIVPAVQTFDREVIPVIKDIVGWFQWLYDKLVGHSIIPDLVRDIETWIKKFPEMFAKWFGEAKDWAIEKFTDLVNWAKGLPGKITDAIDGIKEIPGKVGEWFGQLKDAAINKATELVDWVRGLPGQITSALGNVGNMLYDAGRSILQGLINGLYSMLQNAYNAAADILGQIRNLFPFSPAREGPFSGKGWTLHSGRSLAEGFAEGMDDGQGAVSRAAYGLTGAAVTGIAPAGMTASALTGASASAGGQGRGLHIGSLILQMQGIVDLRQPSQAARQFLLEVREGLRRIEGEYA